MEDIIKAKTYICDVIDYDRDIKPFPLIKIYSGVGSGKSHFAAQMITGSEKYGIPEQNVLIITSRRAKVEETLKEMGAAVTERITRDGNLNFEVYRTDEECPCEYEKYQKQIKHTTVLGESTYLTYNKSVICTNAYISAYLRNVYNPDDPITHIWNKFDAIIVDEVHSLVTDATYQSATFDVLAFIQEYLELYKSNQLQEDACKHLILMTGTPEPFEAHVKLDFPEEATNTMELFDKCKNVVPKNVIIVDEQTARRQMRELLSGGEKVIYFTNHTLTQSAAMQKFNLPKTINIGVSFSNEEKRKGLPQDEQEKINDIDKSLATQSLIPDGIQLFVTTSRNKEGINIHNTDFNNMFVETHLMYDIVQMAGRVRAGIDNLYIISNTDQYRYNGLGTDRLFTKKVMVANKDTDSNDEANKYLTSAYLTNEAEIAKSYEDRKNNIMHYIKYIEDRFDYVRYSVFKQKFEYFYMKETAEKMAMTQIEMFRNTAVSNNNEYFERWFPNSVVRSELSAKERGAAYLHSIIGNKPFVKLSKEELRKHLSYIRILCDSELTSANPILHLVDDNFNCIESGKNYILYYGKEDPRTKKKAMRTRRKP
jgi:hypothetical protein